MAMKIADNLKFPADAITQTFGFLGRKGSGKTYAAGKLAELLLKDGGQVVVLDPIGNWFGLRLDKSGKKPSQFKIPILGGERGDVPLEHTGGKLAAQFVVDTGSSAILDVSPFRKGQRKEFVADFAEELFHRKKQNRTPMHLVIEEAQVFAPQRAGRGEERMLGAMEDIVRLGRNVGIGCSMISQRPQSVNKEVLNQAEPLVVFQLVAKQERDAVARWCEHVGEDANQAMKELPEMQNGDCLFWSPAWLRNFISTRFLPKETFDASATPEVGGKTSSPVQLKPVDLEALKSAMADTIEREKANDPKELRKQIAQLKKELSGQKPEVDEGAINRAVAAAVRDRDNHWQAELKKLESALKDRHKRLSQIETLAHLNGDAAIAVDVPETVVHRPVHNPPRKVRAAKRSEAVDMGTSSDFKPNGAQQRILNALAQLEAMGHDNPPLGAVGFLAKIKPTGGHFSNTVGPLSTHGLVERSDGMMRLTAEGRSLADQPEANLSLEEYHRRISDLLKTGAQRRIFDAIRSQNGDDMSIEDVGEVAEIDPSGGHFSNSIGPISTLGLIERRSGMIHPTELMYPDGLV